MYKKKGSILKKVISGVLAATMALAVSPISAIAETPSGAGKYDIDATLSCYVNAMGGVEFSDGYGLLTDTTVEVKDDGSATATISLGKTTGLSVYTVPCTAFIGTDEAPGYYKNGTVTKENVSYTVSDDTAANKNGNVNYITSITLPVETSTSEYTMWLYLDSNVMGCQLGDGSGTGASNTPGVATKHTAKLTIDWSSAVKKAQATSTKTQSANVEYVVSGGYEVEIPATITINAATKKGAYTVTAKNFVIAENDYVTVTASESGSLSNGTDKIRFKNTLAGGQLKADGNKLTGEIEIIDTAVNPGKYTGTIDFVINYFAVK